MEKQRSYRSPGTLCFKSFCFAVDWQSNNDGGPESLLMLDRKIRSSDRKCEMWKGTCRWVEKSKNVKWWERSSYQKGGVPAYLLHSHQPNGNEKL